MSKKKSKSLFEFATLDSDDIIAPPSSYREPSKIPPNLPQGNLLITAASNSGKSVLINNLLLKKKWRYLEEYSKIYLISPTIHMDNSYEILHKYIESQREMRYKKYRKLIKKGWKPQHIPRELYPDADKIIIHDSYDEEYIKDILDTKERDEKILLVIDDCVCELKKANQNSILERVFLRERHNNVFCWISVQKYTKISPAIRINSPCYIFFKLSNKELQRVAEELAENSVEEFEQIYDLATKDRFSFLYIDKRQEHRYSKKFQKKIVPRIAE